MRPRPQGLWGLCPMQTLRLAARRVHDDLIRRDGVYVLKTVKDEFCTGWRFASVARLQRLAAG